MGHKIAEELKRINPNIYTIYDVGGHFQGGFRNLALLWGDKFLYKP